MRKLLGIIVGLLLLTACQETLEQRCAREAKEYSQKNCPAPVAKDVVIDSMSFDVATHTLTYAYTVSGVIDDTTFINKNNPREQLLRSLKNATAMTTGMPAIVSVMCISPPKTKERSSMKLRSLKKTINNYR